MSNSDITSRGKEYAALIYTLGINADCREHLSRLYDKESRCVNPAGVSSVHRRRARRRREVNRLFIEEHIPPPGRFQPARRIAGYRIFRMIAAWFRALSVYTDILSV